MMTIADAEEGKEYVVNLIRTDDEELKTFLFSLGCYSGEPHKKRLIPRGTLT